jgi:hypothetical protein
MGAQMDIRIYKPLPRKGEGGKGGIKSNSEDDKREAQTYYGNSGYSGTIANTPGITRWEDRVFENKGTRRTEIYSSERDRMESKRIPITGQERAEVFAEQLAMKWEGAVAVPFLYSPGRGMKRRKGWVVGARCAT